MKTIYFLSCFVLILLISACKNDKAKTIQYINQPQKGDIYTVMEENTFNISNNGEMNQSKDGLYTLYKIDSIAPDSMIYFATLKNGSYKKTDIALLKKHSTGPQQYDNKVRPVRNKKDLMEMLSREEILNVERN